jgi:hypothetical protein
MIRDFFLIFEHNITSLEGEGVSVLEKFSGDNFNLWKVALERLVSMDLWALWINPRKLHLPTLISK